jgi:hypothetical protein
VWIFCESLVGFILPVQLTGRNEATPLPHSHFFHHLEHLKARKRTRGVEVMTTISLHPGY